MSKQYRYDVQRENTASKDNLENSVENFRDVFKQNMVLTLKLLQHYYPLVVTNFCPPSPLQRSCLKLVGDTYMGLCSFFTLCRGVGHMATRSKFVKFKTLVKLLTH